MRKILFLFSLILFISSAVFAQGVKPSAISGEVVSVSDNKIVLKTKDGEMDANLSANTQYFRVPPENPSLKAAVASTLQEISVGDKLLVTGIMAEDKKSLPAKSVYLISKSDIAQRDSKETQDWRTRGIAGKVVGYNPQTSEITVTVRGLVGERTVIVKPNSNTEYFRYAPDSVKFSEAKKSKISEIEKDDAIRVLGNKNADGSQMEAEKIVTGAFKTVIGTVKAVNVETNEVTITDIQTKKDVTIVVSDSSVLKQFPPDMAQRMAQFQMGGGQGGMRPPTQGGQGQTPQPQQQNPNGQGQGGGMRQGGGGFDDLLERFPNIKISDLKVGEEIAVSSTKSADPSRIRAIKLVSGIEPFVKMAQATGGGGNRGGGGGANTSFTIPGLDGFGGF